jgi:tRNA-Thr(GGU) m(6)t(6)A37 methyltransferase TsaA
MEIKPIAYIENDFTEKFGIPRQSGRVKELRGKIVFTPEYRNDDALREIHGFSHLWLIFDFSESHLDHWSPIVRPPRLGGNKRVGVFASRSPFRPNPLGLSCVKISSIEPDTPEGPVINVTGADLMDGTPIYDIKPYIRYADARPEAVCGYVDQLEEKPLKVVLPGELAQRIKEREVIPSLIETLRLDPRPSYHSDPHREYGMSFAGYNVRFTVIDGVLEVIDVHNLQN